MPTDQHNTNGVIYYVNVNEEGEDYDYHATFAAAEAVQKRFPNDTIQVRRATVT